MPRSLPSAMITDLAENTVSPIFMVDLTLASGVQHIWSGVGTLSYGANSYLGVGSLGAVGDITEGSAVKAEGTSIALSGIDPTLLGDCLNDIQQGAPVNIWLGLVAGGAIAAAYTVFTGTVDKPSFVAGPETIAIQLALESKMTNLQRPTMRRYTMADQRYYYSDDIGFSWVEILNDIALLWG